MKSMKSVFTFVALAGTLFFAGFAAARQNPPLKLTWESFDAVRDRVLPSRKERGWREVRWRSDFGQAVAEAARKDMPVLLWAMNGSPLGCT
jgi:hypothetical protein